MLFDHVIEMSLTGRVGSKGELRQVGNNQTSVIDFRVAATRNVKKGAEYVDETTWVRVTLWGRMAEVANDHIGKGDLVQVRGTPQVDENGNPRVWTDKEGNVRASYEISVGFDGLFKRYLKANGNGESSYQDGDLGKSKGVQKAVKQAVPQNYEDRFNADEIPF